MSHRFKNCLARSPTLLDNNATEWHRWVRSCWGDILGALPTGPTLLRWCLVGCCPAGFLVGWRRVTVDKAEVACCGQTVGIAQGLQHWTRDWKVAGSNPCSSSGRFSSPCSASCALFLVSVPPLCYCSSTQKILVIPLKVQVTAKHAYTLHMWPCMKWHGAWLYGLHRMRQDGSSFMWHQPCQRCKYTTSVAIQKRAMEGYSLFIHSHASAARLLQSG